MGKSPLLMAKLILLGFERFDIQRDITSGITLNPPTPCLRPELDSRSVADAESLLRRETGH